MVTITDLLAECDGPWDVESFDYDERWGKVLTEMSTYTECAEWVARHTGPDFIPLRIVPTSRPISA